MTITKIICLCGSSKFKPLFRQKEKELTLKGYIVLLPAIFSHYDNITLSNKQKDDLDLLHKEKIKLADSILIIGGLEYIGFSTRKEIDYAKSLNKKISYL